MSLLGTEGRPMVVLRRVTRHTWGADPERVVVVAVIRDGEDVTARVLGADGSRAVEVERKSGARIVRGRGVVIAFDDGTEWALVGVGCSCRVPASLKGLNPFNVPAP